jgi:hypothetical protein
MEYDEASSSPEEPLPGTFSTLVKVGNTVRRSTGPWTHAVHALLRHLERVGFDAAPRVLGVDAREREILILSYIPVNVPRGASPEVATDRALLEVGRLLRRYHEAVSGFSLPPGVEWYGGTDLGPGSVVCYNDLTPRNTVFGEGSTVAFVYFDLASPAQPAWDVAHLAWQFVSLADDEGCAPGVDLTARPSRPSARLGRWLRALRARPGRGFPELLARRIETTASGIEALAAEGVPAHRRWAERGVPHLVRADRDWVERHREVLREALLKS